MKNFKNGFTLAEVVIVLVLVGVLGLILVPMVKNMMPDDHNIKYRKAFTTIQQIIYDMTSNEEICQKYNVNTGTITDHPLQFCNVVSIDTNDEHETPNSYTARTLNEELCKRLNTTTDVVCGGTIESIPTTNGMTFTLSEQDIDLDSDFGVDTDDEGVKTDSVVAITVNFGDGTDYTIQIDKDGKVTAPAGDEANFLKNNPTD